MAEIDRLSVALDFDGSAFSRGLKKAVSETRGFASDIQKIGTSADKSAKQGEAAMSRLSRAIRGVRTEASKPINLKVAVDTSQISGAQREIRNLRNEVSQDAVMRIGVDTSQLSTARSEVQGLRQDVSQEATMRLSVDTSQLNTARSQVGAVKQDASQSPTMRIIADMSGIQGMTDQIEYVRSNADQGGMFVVRTDFDGSDAEIGMNAMRAQASNTTTMKIVADADIAGAMTKLAALDGQIAGTNGRRITVYGNVDQSISQAIPAALGDLNTRLQQSQTVMAIFASFSTVVTDAMGAGIATAAVGAAGALGSFAITLGTGVVGAAGAAGSAMITAGVAVQGIGQFAAGAISNTLGLGKGMFDLAGATKAAGKEVKAFEGLVAAMPAGTDAAANAQQRLALAQQYEAGLTQLQISWWGKFGGAANTLAASLNTLRLGFYEIGSVAGGMMIPTITEFVNIATSQLPYVALAAGMMVRAFNEGTIGLRAFLESAQGTSALVSIWEGIGRAAEPAMTIISQGLIVMLQGFTPAIQYGTQLLEVLANLSVQAGNWAKGAEGTATIEAAWASMVGTAQQLWEVVANLGEGFAGLGIALAGTGLGEEMLTGLVNLSAQFRDLMSASGEGRQAVTDFMESVRPALEAIVPAAMKWAEAFFHVIDSVVGLKNEATGLSVLEEIVTSLGNAAGPFAEMFIHTFETIGPLLPPLIDELAEFFAFFGTSTPQMEAFLSVGLTLLGWFNDLPDPVKNTVANLIAFNAVMGSLTGISFSTVASGLLGIGGALLQWNRLSNISSKLDGLSDAVGRNKGAIDTALPSQDAETKSKQAMGTQFDTTGKKADTFGGKLKNLGKALAGLGAGLALGAIVIDIVYHWPDIKQGFAQAYTDAREGGAGVGESFVAGLGAAVEATTIGSMISTAVNGAMDIVDAARGEGPSLVDVIMGDASLEDVAAGDTIAGSVISGIQSAWSSINEFLSGLTPEVSLWDVLTGEATLQEGAEGGSPVAGMLVSLQEGWASVEEWLGGLAPSVSLWDVLTGGATLEEGAEGGSPAAGILLSLQEAWAGIEEWIAGLAPEITLMDVIMGSASMEEAAESGGIAANVILALGEAWTAITEWIAGLAPEITLMDVIMGNASMEEAGESGGIAANVILALGEAWTAITEWIAGLAPEITLMDVLMGNASMEEAAGGGNIAAQVIIALQGLWDSAMQIWEGIKTTVSEAMSYIWNDVIVASWEGIKATFLDAMSYIWNDVIVATWEGIKATFLEAMSYIWNDVIIATWEGIKTTFLEAMTYIWNDIIIATWEGIKTTFLEAMTYIWNDIIIATWEGIKTTFLEAMTYIWNDIIIATWEGIKTTFLEAMTYIWNDIIVFYWESIKTTFLEAMTYIWNDIIVFYWESIKTSISDAMLYVWNDIIVYYWESIKTSISDAMSYIWNDVIVYYWEQIKTTVYDAVYYLWNDVIVYYWEQIKSATSTFVGEWATILGDGIKSGVNTALGWLRKLLEGVNTVLTAIGAPTINAEIPLLEASGGSTDDMARGGSTEYMARGGKGTPGAQPRHIVWNEQNNGREWWIATGDGNQNRQRSLLAGAAGDLGMGVVPMRRGGSQDAGRRRKPTEREDHSTDRRGGSWGNVMSRGNGSLRNMPYTTGIQGISYTTPTYGPVTMMQGGGVIDFSQPPSVGWAPAAQDLVDDVTGKFGASANSYLGHGEQGGSSEDYTADFWGGSQGTAIDSAVGEAIKDYVLANYDFGYMIWNGSYYTPGGVTSTDAIGEPDPHTDHVHVSLTGGAGGGGSGIGSKLLSIAKGIWDGISSALTSALDFGDGPLWDGVEGYFGTLPGMAWEWLKSKIPSARNLASSFVGGPENETALNIGESMAAAMGWTGDQWEALKDLWGRESNWDYTATNPDSGAYGIPQALGHGDIGSDPASQIEWGLNYIAQNYGDPIAANEFQLANGGYRRGGSTDSMQAGGVVGSGGRLAGANRSIERLLPEYAAREFPDETTSTTSRTSTASTATTGAGLAGTGEKKLSRRQRRRQRRRERRQGTTATGMTGTTLSGSTTSTPAAGSTGTLSESISRTSGTSGSATAMPSSSGMGGRGGTGSTGSGTGRLTSSPISQSINATGSGEFTDVQNTGQTSGRGARIRMRPRSTFKNRSSVNQSTTGTGMTGTRGGRSGAGRRRRRGSATSGRISSGGSVTQTGSNSTQRVNISRQGNRRNRRSRMAEGGYIGSIGMYHNGGSISGLGEQLIAAEAGERVLSQSQNRTFEALVDGITRWSPGVTQSGGSNFGRSELEEKLDKVIEVMERGNRTATPVRIDNTNEMQRLIVSTFMAGIESDGATEVLDRKLTEGVRFASQLGGV